jgi:hypothetical protein
MRDYETDGHPRFEEYARGVMASLLAPEWIRDDPEAGFGWWTEEQRTLRPSAYQAARDQWGPDAAAEAGL